MDYEGIIFQKSNGVVEIVLNAPEKRNAVSPRMRESLVRAFDEASADDDVRVVILTGAGSAFSAGGDVEALRARATGEMELSRDELLRRLGDGVMQLITLEKPIIAAVNGLAVGAGFSLVMSCDIRMASASARFGAPFVMRGLVPDSGLTYFLPRTVGMPKAMELMLLSEMIDARTAERLGIVNEVVEPDDLLTRAHQLADKIALLPPVAVQLTKRLVYRSMIDDISRHLDCESAAQETCFRTEDFRERARAFLEKRQPLPFKGR